MISVQTPKPGFALHSSHGNAKTKHAAHYKGTGSTPTPPSPINQSTHNLQLDNSYKWTQLTLKTASVVPPEDGRLTPEPCRGLTL
jgi:hypothetical protein